MKDSGVEWIGEIPSYFNQIKLKYISDIKYGLATALEEGETKGFKIISLYNVTKSGKLIFNKTGYVNMEKNEIKEYKLKKGDLLFNWRNGSSDHVGKTAYFDLDGYYIHVSFLLRLRFDLSKYNSLFYRYVLNNLKNLDYFGSSKTQVNKSFNQTELMNLTIVSPLNKFIEDRICKYLSKKLLDINNLIQKTKKSIDKYKEYKKSLIFEAVTGKIDLRDYELEGGKKIAEHNNSREAERKELSEVN